MFKEFGIRLNFTPTIAGDVIRLKVKPEVSSLDFANGVTPGRVPDSRADRRGAPRPRSSCATASRSRLPGCSTTCRRTTTPRFRFLSKLPIIGTLFKSKSERAEQTELMVLITPRLVRPLDPDEVPPLPTLPGRFLKPSGDIGSRSSGRVERRRGRRTGAGRRHGAQEEAAEL